MTDSRWTPSPDEEDLRAPELPPTPKLPEPPQVEFERPKLPGVGAVADFSAQHSCD
jgi:hypothetical protein